MNKTTSDDHAPSGTDAARIDPTVKEVGLMHMLDIVGRHKLVFVSVIVGVALVALVASLLMTPVYRAEALLIAVRQDGSVSLPANGSLGGLAALAGINVSQLSLNERKNESIALLLSREFTIDFLDDERLLPVLFADRWDDDAGAWNDPDEAPTLLDGYRYFDRNVRGVTEDARTGLVTLIIDWEDPQLAARWADTLIERVNQRMRQRAIAEAEKSLEYLNNELDKTGTIEIRQAIYGLIESEISKIMLANVREEFVFRVIDPPAAPDLDDPISPRRAVMVLGGLVLGGLLGLLASLFLERRQELAR